MQVLQVRVLGRDEQFSAFPCAFAPHPPAPFSHKGLKVGIHSIHNQREIEAICFGSFKLAALTSNPRSN